MAASYQRYAGILVDVFYDHILEKEWERYAGTPLDAFSAQLHADIAPLPPAPRDYMTRMVEWDVLGAYRELDGVANALRRINQRLNEWRPGVVTLKASLPQLTANYTALSADFAEIFSTNGDACAPPPSGLRRDAATARGLREKPLKMRQCPAGGPRQDTAYR